MKRIVICIVSYNQEDVIGRTLDSILNQKEWGLFKIIVSDDCSKDRTWEILQEYKGKYPEIMDIHRNEHNLGIYGNVAQSNTYLPDDYDFEGHRELIGMQAGDVPITYADSSALERDFSFTPKIGIREGLRSFAEWYRDYYGR